MPSVIFDFIFEIAKAKVKGAPRPLRCAKTRAAQFNHSSSAMVDAADQPRGQQRPYRSKKKKPCDACRRRRVGCLIEEGQNTCSLCRHRGLACTFLSGPPKKKSRRTTSPRSRSHAQGGEPSSAASASTPGQGQILTTAVPGQTTVVPGQTFLYAGPSGDQGVYLLRHLPFDANCVFGTSNWTIWRASAGSSGSAYFTIYPNVLLDAEGDAFDIRQIPTAARTHHQELLDLYYRYVHPTLPILECRQELEGAIAARTVPASLLAAVYSMAVFFWSYSGALRGEPKINREALLSFTYKSVMFETRNPNLRTVQTLLLYLQMPPKLVREPNHPGSWVVTAQVVAVAQEAGLHIDPERLEISPRECKLRRILWWAVYLQDKWLASWLGRPSHISNDQFTVKSLSIMDFTNDWGNVDSAAAPSIQQFISLCHLTPVLADVLDMFYSPKARLEATQQHLALLLASEAASKLQEWQSQHMFTARPQSEDPNAYALIFAYYAIEALIHGALFVCTGSVTSGGVADESQLFEKLLDVLELMLTRNPTGFWLSYCKGNLGIIGSFMLTVFLSSVDEHTLHIRQTVLQRYQRLLEELCVRFEFAALPSVRLNLFFKRLFPEYMDENLEERPSLE